MSKKCSIKNCKRQSIAKKLCSLHYQRYKYCKRPLSEINQINPLIDSWKGETCFVSNCNRKILAKGFCSLHYQRNLAYGSPIIIKTRERGTGRIDEYGYHVSHLKDQNPRRTHRIIMEKYIGRPLLQSEKVHHLNGNKLDNRIENLRMLSHKEHIAIHCRKLICWKCKWKTSYSLRSCLKHPTNRWCKIYKSSPYPSRCGHFILDLLKNGHEVSL